MILDIVIRHAFCEVRKVNHEKPLKNVLGETASVVVKDL